MIQERDIETLRTMLAHTTQLRMHIYTLVYARVYLHNELLNCSLRRYRREAQCSQVLVAVDLGAGAEDFL